MVIDLLKAGQTLQAFKEKALIFKSEYEFTHKVFL